jgi:hypothetical protein
MCVCGVSFDGVFGWVMAFLQCRTTICQSLKVVRFQSLWVDLYENEKGEDLREILPCSPLSLKQKMFVRF